VEFAGLPGNSAWFASPHFPATLAAGRGATTAEYGIHAFPTILLIGRDGRLVEKMSRDPDVARAEIEKLLETK